MPHVNFLLSLVLVFLGSASCSDANFRERFELGPARILGLIFSHPEINPGQSTSIQPIFSFENQTSETLEHRLRSCADPGLVFGVNPTCENSTDINLMVDWTAFSFTSPNVKSEILGPLGNVTATADFLISSSEAEKTNGKIILVEYSVRINGTTVLNSFGKVRVTDPTLKPVKNQNPSLTNILLNSQSLASRPTALKNDLAATFDPTSLDTGEEFLASYFISRGEVEYSRTLGEQSTEWELTQTDLEATETITVIVVGRDERGGVTALVRTGL